MTPKEQAISFLEGLMLDIKESKTGMIDIERPDLEQLANCIEVIKSSGPAKAADHVKGE